MSLKIAVGLVLHSRFPMFLFWGDDAYCFYNDGYRPSLGVEGKHPCIGKKAIEVWQENWFIVGPQIKQVMSGGEATWHQDQPVPMYRNGRIEEVYWTYSYSPVFNEQGTVSGVLVACMETTYTLQNHKKLKESESRYRRLFDTTPIAVTEEDHTAFYEKMSELREQGITDFDGYFETRKDELYEMLGLVRILGVNQGLLDLTGARDLDEFVANRAFFFVGMTEQTVYRLMTLLYNGGGFFREETVIKNMHGELRQVWVSLNYPSEPPYSSIPITMLDVTDSKKADSKIRESEQRFRTLIEEAPVATCLFLGRELRIEIANEMIIAIMGKGRSVLGKPLSEAIPELEGQPFLLELQKVFDTGETFENRNARGELIVDGVRKTLYFDYIFKPLKDENGEVYGILDMTIDVTDHVLARRELQESESRFRTLAEALPQMVWMQDAKGEIEYASRHWADYSGYEDVTQAWRWMAHPEDMVPLQESWKQALENGLPFRHEVRLRNKQGEYNWHYSLAEPVRDDNGQIVKWIGTLFDIQVQKEFSEKLEKEVEERTRDLQRSNEDLQQFAHVASHDLKEPVRKIILFQNRLRDELGEGANSRVMAFLQKIEASSLRMYSMIDGVLAYSSLNGTGFSREWINLNALVDDIRSDLEVVIAQKRAILRIDLLPSVFGDRVLLYQLFYNLIANSLKFAKPDEDPEIHMWSGQVVEDRRSYREITLTDNGIGFSNKDVDQIFQPFSRLNSKDQFEGTGLGLSLCKKIVERHGGMIRADGTPGVGAVFTILLPL